MISALKSPVVEIPLIQLLGSMKNTRRNLFQTSVSYSIWVRTAPPVLVRVRVRVSLVLVLLKLINKPS